MLTPQMAADDTELKLGLSAATIRRMCAQEKIPCVVYEHGYLLDHDQLMAWKERRKKGPWKGREVPHGQ